MRGIFGRDASSTGRALMGEENTLPDGLLTVLRQVDTPTVCNAIEVAQGRRGFSNFTRETMIHSVPEVPAMVGYARTAKIAGAVRQDEAPSITLARRLDYFRHMARGGAPGVAVIEDTDGRDCVGAWWGEVHVAVHKGLGLVGAVTNGVMRDLNESDADFPVLAGSVGPSHAFVHLQEIGNPVEVFGMKVEEGDLIHADRHGALVVPADVLHELPSAIATVVASEALILGPARSPDFDIDKLEKAWAAFEAVRT